MNCGALLTLTLALVAVSSGAIGGEPPLNPRVTQDNIHHTICVHGWSENARPSVYYTRHIKFTKLVAAGIPPSQARIFELDHRIPIELGGSPYSPDNLFLQPWPEAKQKDVEEDRLHREVCAGLVPLAAARACMWTDWKKCRSL